MNHSLVKKLAPPFALGAAITLGLGWTSYRMVRDSTSDHAWVEHTHIVQIILEKLRSSLLEAEKSALAFGWTGVDSDLSPYVRSLPIIHDQINKVFYETRDNSTQTVRITRTTRIIEARLALLDRMIQGRRADGRSGVESLLQDEQGRKLTEQIAGLVDEMLLEEARLLLTRERAAADSLRWAMVAIAVGVVANTLIVAFVFRVIVRVINLQHQAEVSLRFSEAEAAKMALVAARTHNAVMILDMDGRIEWANLGFTRITSYTFDEVQGRSVTSVLSGEETDLAISEQALKQIQSGLACRMEFIAYAKSGRPFTADFEGQPVFDHAVGGSKIIVLMSDVTDRHRVAGRIALQHAVTRILADAESLTEAIPELMAAIGHHLMMDISEYWTVDRDTVSLKNAGHWWARGDLELSFVAPSCGYVFQRNEGLPGRIWGSGEAIWISDLIADETFVRKTLAGAAGLHPC